MLTGGATAEGTARYSRRFAGPIAPDHFRQVRGLWLSSIGLGTYLGEPTAEHDAAYEGAIREAVGAGCNVLDGAINYRFQRSERSIGRALAALVEGGQAKRDEIVVATKGGFLSFDGGYPADPGAWVVDTFIRPGIIEPEEIAADCHCMAPAYIDHQFETSLRNLGLDHIDIYYIHNPETQLGAVDRETFTARLRAAFRVLEEKVAVGALTCYGTATWDGYRRAPGSADHMALIDILDAARAAAEDVGVPEHHFGAIQLPLSLAMPEALLAPTQPSARGGEAASWRTPLEAAAAAGLIVMASASILQGHLPAKILPEMAERIPGGTTQAQKAIQWVRSAPGLATALVGMKSVGHVRENMSLAADARMTPAQHAALTGRAR